MFLPKYNCGEREEKKEKNQKGEKGKGGKEKKETSVREWRDPIAWQREGVVVRRLSERSRVEREER